MSIDQNAQDFEGFHMDLQCLLVAVEFAMGGIVVDHVFKSSADFGSRELEQFLVENKDGHRLFTPDLGEPKNVLFGVPLTSFEGGDQAAWGINQFKVGESRKFRNGTHKLHPLEFCWHIDLRLIHNSCPKWSVQLISFLEYIRFSEGSIVAKKRIDELMLLLVGLFPRELSCFQQRESNCLIPDRVAVFAIIEQGDSEMSFREISKLVAAHLQPGLIPTGVRMDRSPQQSTAHIKGGIVSSDIYREIGLKQFSALIPMNICFKINSSRIMVEDDGLLEFGLFRDLEYEFKMH